MIKYMLDTNILIYTIKNRPKKVREAFKRHSDYLSMSSVTLGELIFGAERSAQVTRNLQDIEGLAAHMDVLPFDYQAATHFGQVRAELTKTGKPIGPYDSMIAGHARAWVDSRDEQHARIQTCSRSARRELDPIGEVLVRRTWWMSAPTDRHRCHIIASFGYCI